LTVRIAADLLPTPRRPVRSCGLWLAVACLARSRCCAAFVPARFRLSCGMSFAFHELPFMVLTIALLAAPRGMLYRASAFRCLIRQSESPAGRQSCVTWFRCDRDRLHYFARLRPLLRVLIGPEPGMPHLGLWVSGCTWSRPKAICGI
jgi:hypothetical protein